MSVKAAFSFTYSVTVLRFGITLSNWLKSVVGVDIIISVRKMITIGFISIKEQGIERKLLPKFGNDISRVYKQLF